MAAEYLKKHGYNIIEKNYFSRYGELDIVAQDGPYLVFAEVKYRSNGMMGMPAEAITYRKQQAMFKTARYYMYQNRYPEEQPCRFDVVSILGDEIELIKNAFEVF